MIRRNPSIPDNVLELMSQKSIGDYARAYQDDLAQAYEDLDLLYFPHFPLDLDLDFWRGVTLPEAAKKLGVNSGIENSLFIRKGHQFLHDTSHILCRVA